MQVSKRINLGAEMEQLCELLEGNHNMYTVDDLGSSQYPRSCGTRPLSSDLPNGDEHRV